MRVWVREGRVGENGSLFKCRANTEHILSSTSWA